MSNSARRPSPTSWPTPSPGSTTVTTASFHRQAVVDPGSLVVSAHDADGVVEAVELPGPRFALGVQWHPEKRDDLRPFDALARACAS